METKYYTDATTSQWPLINQYNSFWEKVIAPSSFATKFETLLNRCENESMISKEIYKRQLIQDNFVKLEFTLDLNGHVELVEVPMYSIFSVVGTLGGTLNLWNGITVLFFVELMKMMINIVKRCTFEGKKEPHRCPLMLLYCCQVCTVCNTPFQSFVSATHSCNQLGCSSYSICKRDTSCTS